MAVPTAAAATNTIRKVLGKARQIVGRRNTGGYESGLKIDCSGQAASDLIKARLDDGAPPCVICRFGSVETAALLQHLDINYDESGTFSKSIRYILGQIGPFWWHDSIRESMRRQAGFFPVDDDALTRFGEQMLGDISSIDVLGAWQPQESRLAHLLVHAKAVRLRDLEPYYHADPWSAHLEGRTVLVVHPFEESVRHQYRIRERLFRDPRVLPRFDLKTLKAVQSIGSGSGGFSSWFDALEWMCEEITHTSFDVAIIGAGAYGLPLAAHVKRMGKKAVHLGGATQLLFGIKGKRWDQWPFFRKLYNDDWIRPLPGDIPPDYQQVEGGCYW